MQCSTTAPRPSGWTDDIWMIGRIGATLAVLSLGILPAEPTSWPLTMSTEVDLVADTTALVLCGTTCPTPDARWIVSVRDRYVAPTHPSQDIDYLPVTAPMTMWPATGVMRLLGLILGDPQVFGPGTGAWPDEPLWKLSGLFDPTADQSLQTGAAGLEAAIAEHSDDDVVVYGYSQGAGVANVVKKRLAELYTAGSEPPKIDFVLGGDPNLPNGGLMSRFPGLYIPIIDMPFNGPAATDTPFSTVEINQQYDGFSDFPLHPRNMLATMNALMGMFYVHTWPFVPNLPDDPTSSPAYQGTHGDTSYYFFATADLPLFGPMRTLGVPEKLIDVVEPFFRVLVELGYDRSIPAWEPTPARPATKLNIQQIATDLKAAVHEGADNARALFNTPKITPAPASAAPPSPASAAPAGRVTAPLAAALADDPAAVPPRTAPSLSAAPKGPANTGQAPGARRRSTTRSAAVADNSGPANAAPANASATSSRAGRR